MTKIKMRLAGFQVKVTIVLILALFLWLVMALFFIS